MKLRNWFWGIFFLCSAVLVLVNQVAPFAGVGIFRLIFSLLLAAITIQSVFQLNFFGIFIPPAVIAILFSDAWGLQAFTPWPVLIAALFASIGCSILFRGVWRARYWKWRNRHPQMRRGGPAAFEASAEDLSDNVVSASVSMGSASKYLHSDALERAHLRCTMGDLKVYFDQARLSPNGAEAYLECTMGDITLYLPRTWNVNSQVSASIGGVNGVDQRVHNPDMPTLTLTGYVHMGAVQIKYI
ncbi:MAG: cell wall-active antibiotics response protein [Clostridiales bacterium]|nr:cell wall-active antibiotics response protein [Clostridiales bacterium]